VTPEGLEPSTRRLRVACSAKLSYGAVQLGGGIIPQRRGVSTNEARIYLKDRKTKLQQIQIASIDRVKGNLSLE
jgi:hypothetical protein